MIVCDSLLTPSWEPVKNYRSPTTQPAAAIAMSGESIYIIGGEHFGRNLGGEHFGRYLDTVTVYDMKTAQWTSSQRGTDLRPLSTPCRLGNAIATKSEIIVVGGWQTQDGSPCKVQSLSLCSSSLQEWQSETYCGVTPGGAAACILSDCLIVCGGFKNCKRIDRVDLYDLCDHRDGTCSQRASCLPLPEGRDDVSLIVFNNQLLAIGAGPILVFKQTYSVFHCLIIYFVKSTHYYFYCCSPARNFAFWEYCT